MNSLGPKRVVCNRFFIYEAGMVVGIDYHLYISTITKEKNFRESL